jgi:hypothetical protein
MKTLTEFSTLVLRKAADARAAAAGAEGDALNEAVATALGVQPDRAARLLEAVDLAGDLDTVRLVRVYQGETGPHGSVSRGEFHYAVDRVAAQAPRRRGRDDRGGGGGGRDRGGDRGPRRDKPRGLGSLKVGAPKDDKDDRDDRPGRGEMPRAGIGWQLTAAPREMREGRGGPGRGGPRRGPRRGPGGPGGPGGFGGPGGPRPEGDRRDRRPDRGDRRGPRPPRPPRPDLGPANGPALGPPPEGEAPRPEAVAGAEGAGQERRPRRQRKPIGPDANGLGPDGTPWDPERRRKRQEERAAKVNAAPTAPVEAVVPSESPVEPAAEAPKE